MIPPAFLQAWSAKAPWPDLRQVEQDLIICRALCDLFNAPALTDKIAFRGGTAIHKLLFKQPLRYSEDIDLVQTKAEPIGATVDAIREALSWLGRCQREQAGHSMHLVFKFTPEIDAAGDAQAQGRDQHPGAREPARHQAVSLCSRKRLVPRHDRDRVLRARGTVRHEAARAAAATQRTATCSICIRDSSSSRWPRKKSSHALTTIWPWKASRSRVRWPSSACWRSSPGA